MNIFSKPKEKKELTLVFDIGSASVGGALFLMQKSGIPKIIYSIREPIFIDGEVDFSKLFSSAIKSLDIVARKIFLMKLGAPKEISCVLSSAWYASQTRTIKLEKNTAFTFTSKLADSLVQKEVAIFKEEHSISDLDIGVRLIELKNMNVMLNGYSTSDPLGKKAREVEMTIFISMSPEQILEKIEKAIGRHFYHTKIKFSSFVMASFVVAREVFISEKDFLLVDVGGEVTDISLIKNDVLCESISFPMGKNFILRGVESILKHSPSEAKSLVSLYKDNHADEKTEKRIGLVVNRLRSEWSNSFQESINRLSDGASVPSLIFVTADSELADIFAETIKLEQVNQYASTESKFKVVLFSTKVLHDFATLEKNSLNDSSLVIESIYINSFLR